MIEDEPPSRMSGDNLGKFSLLTVLLVTVLLTSGLIADRQKVTLALVCGVGFFFCFGGLVILALSGQLARIMGDYQKEQTVRQYQKLYFTVAPAPERPTLSLPQAEGLLAPQGQRFIPAVPPVDEGVKLAAYDFVYALFIDGSPDPKRILPEGSKSPGQIQFKKPRPEVVEYLLALGLVSEGGNRMLFFNTAHYPTLVEAGRAIKLGRKG